MLEDLVREFFVLVSSYLGQNASSTMNESGALKAFLLPVFLAGSLVFMAYRSFLTAELTVQRNSMPFETLDQLYESVFRYTNSRNCLSLFQNSN